MIRKPENVTVIILSEEEAKELSVRHALRCLWRDCRYLCRALWRHVVHYRRVFARGWMHTNHWWMRREN
jgi:hypothetical protein